MNCKTCVFRNTEGLCQNEKLSEDWYSDKNAPGVADMLLYSYRESGTFWVGPMFGCVHYKEKYESK